MTKKRKLDNAKRKTYFERQEANDVKEIHASFVGLAQSGDQPHKGTGPPDGSSSVWIARKLSKSKTSCVFGNVTGKHKVFDRPIWNRHY